MLALLSMGSSAFAQGTLDVPEVARKAGNVKQVVVLENEKKGTVKIRLAGTENYRDLQFDIKLPAGVTAADGKVVIGTDHAVASAVQADEQTVRFVLYSTTGQNLSNDIFALRFLSKLQMMLMLLLWTVQQLPSRKYFLLFLMKRQRHQKK